MFRKKKHSTRSLPAEAELPGVGVVDAKTEIVRLQFNDDELAALRREFDKIDIDGVGEIKMSNMPLLIEQVFGVKNVSEADKRNVMEQLDTDGSGGVSFEEFVESLSLVSGKTVEEINDIAHQEEDKLFQQETAGEDSRENEATKRSSQDKVDGSSKGNTRRRSSQLYSNADATTMQAVLMAPAGPEFPKISKEEAELMIKKLELPEVSHLTKYSKKAKGKSHQFAVNFEDKKGVPAAFPCIKWYGTKGLTKTYKRVFFTHVTRIQQGQESAVFNKSTDKKRNGLSTAEELSFSLFYVDESGERSLDLVADNEAQYRVWFEVCSRLFNNCMNPDANPALHSQDLELFRSQRSSWCNPCKIDLESFLDNLESDPSNVNKDDP